MFGYRIGDRLEGHTPPDISAPAPISLFVAGDASRSSIELEELDLLVSPVSGTIMVVRAQTTFDDATEAEAFGDRMIEALSAQYVRTPVVEVPLGTMPPDCVTTNPATCVKGIHLFKRFVSIQGEYYFGVHVFAVSHALKSTVSVILRPHDADLKGRLDTLLNAEWQELEADRMKSIVERERNGLLKGFN